MGSRGLASGHLLCRLLAALALVAVQAACGEGSRAPSPPGGLVYSANPATYFVGVAIPCNTPGHAGGAPTSYWVIPALPPGLHLDATSGSICGTPTAPAATWTYRVSAANPGGASSADVVITVIDVPPSALAYATNPATYIRGEPIAVNTPTHSGGALASWSVTPPLPDGLLLDGVTGEIVGTPTLVTSTAVYTVKATNTGGSTTADVAISVVDVPPSGLAYPANPATYTKGVAISSVAPSWSGVVDSWSVTPPLPAGLALDDTTGHLSGTPTVVASTATYTVTASNTAGFTSAGVTITVIDVPPSALTYAANPATYTKGVAIISNTPAWSGGAVTSWSVAPPLPAGLALDGATGQLSGTPTLITSTATHTVTATNTGGFTTADVTITVNDVPPSGLSYSPNPASYPRYFPIIPNAPSIAGGAVVSWSVSPPLPAGLALDGTTGHISGTPTVLTSTAVHTVTATNSGGSTAADLIITVIDLPPSGLSYPSNPASYARNFPIIPNVPEVSGGPVESWSVSPPLPAGLSLDGTTGHISGTPTVLTSTAIYTVTAANSFGSATVGLNLTVTGSPAGRFAYAANFGDGTVSAYTLDASTGWLRHAGYALAGKGPVSVTIDPRGRFAFVANATSSDVSAYRIDAVTGALTAAADPVAVGSTPYSVTLDPSGRFAYVASTGSNTVSAFAVDQSTGALAAAAAPVLAGTRPFALAVHPSGRFVYAANATSNDISVFTVNPATGALTSAGARVPAGSGPTFIAIEPTGRFAYVTNAGTSDVSIFAVDATSGALSANGRVGVGTSPYCVTVDPEGRIAYVANYGDGTVSAFHIQTDGSLMAIGGAVAAGANPRSIAVDPSGKFVFVANRNGDDVATFSLDAESGALTRIHQITARSIPASIAVAPGSGPVTYVPRFVLASNGDHLSSYRMNATTGSLTLAGSVPAGVATPSIAVHPSGKFAYAVDEGSGTLSAYAIDPGTGVLEWLGATSTGTSPESVAIDPSGRFAYVANQGSGSVSAYSIDASTGRATGIASVAAGSGTQSVVVDPSGRFAYAASTSGNSISVFAIDPVTGALDPSGAVSASSPIGLVFHPSGRFFFTEGDHVMTFATNPSTGQTPLNGGALYGTTHHIAVEPTGRFAYLAQGVVQEATFDELGRLLIGHYGMLVPSLSSSDVTVDASGRFVCIASAGELGNAVSVFRIDPASGYLTEGGSTPTAGSTSVATVGVVR